MNENGVVNLNVTATVTVEGGASQAVTWSISGDIDSTATNINASGLLTIGENETATTITVTATSIFDATKNNTATVTISSGTPSNVAELFMPDLKIYPNPFTGEIRITGAIVETRHATSVQLGRGLSSSPSLPCYSRSRRRQTSSTKTTSKTPQALAIGR